MFYINEVKLRLVYVLIFLILLLSLLFYYKHLFIFFFTSPIIYIESITHLIYTDPSELLKTYFIVILFVFLYYLFFFLFWQYLDFLKSSLFLWEYKKSLFVFFIVKILVIFVNLFSINFLIPFTWNFFNDFSNSTRIIRSLNIFLELRVEYYFNFLINYFLLANLLLFFFFFLNYICFNSNIKNLFIFRKLFIFLNIMFATFLSPP